MGIEWDLRILTDMLEGFLVALLVSLIPSLHPVLPLSYPAHILYLKFHE